MSISGRLCLNKDAIGLENDCYKFDEIQSEVSNRASGLKSLVGTVLHSDQSKFLSEKLFSFDGGLVTGKDDFEKYSPPYFLRSRRVVEFRNVINMRGGRYIISANPTFELRTKLKSYLEDFHEGIEALTTTRNIFFQLAMADYIKNAIITILNAFLQDEKLGKYKFDNLAYQKLRKDGINIAHAAVNLYYGIFLDNEVLVSAAYFALRLRANVADKLVLDILRRYEDGVFSSRHVTRPEASHPLVIVAAVGEVCLQDPKRVDSIIGAPSGSTELAFAHCFGQRFFKNLQPKVMLFPVSMHSAKMQFDEFSNDDQQYHRWLMRNKSNISGKRILICDDNSSTGQTIDLINVVVERANPQEILISVAESDIVRSKIDINSKNRKSIASRCVYKHSINILPVSKTISPKSDLREILEKRKMEKCVKSRYLNGDGIFRNELIGKLYLDMIRNSTESMLNNLDDDMIIRKFQKTPFSNFHPIKIVFQGARYDSVEHAYQSMKFSTASWERVDQKDIEAIIRKLNRYNIYTPKEDLSKIFSNQDMPPGASKNIANFLRSRGYIRENWDEIKVPIMVDLLICKFSDVELYDMLSDTSGLYLVEGNSWGDTFWGECDGRGRNVLGRILMLLREHDISTLKRQAALIEERLVEF